MTTDPEKELREVLAETLYAFNQLYDQPVDLDGRATGVSGPIPWHAVVEMDDGHSAQIYEQADAVLAAMRRIRSTPEAWRTMESAPKDGRRIILRWASPEGQNPTTEIFRWNSHGGDAGAWMMNDGCELFGGAPAEGRRKALPPVQTLGWLPLPEFHRPSPTTTERQE